MKDAELHSSNPPLCRLVRDDFLHKMQNLTGNTFLKIDHNSCRLEYQPQLVEEAVLRAIVGHQLESVFRSERDALYTIRDDEAREEAFQTLHQLWYERLDLNEPLQEILTYWPILQEQTHRCLIVKAQSKKEVGAELFVATDHPGKPGREARSIIIQLTPELAVQTKPLLHFLRRELLHVVDMLNPEFGYQPVLPKSELGPTYDRLLQGRYRILWDITVDGRLHRDGFLPASIREKHWELFKNAFPGCIQDLERVFAFFFANTVPKHQELVSFSLSPESWFDSDKSEFKSKGICPLCRFPSFDLITPKRLPPPVIAEMKIQNPAWDSSQPICQQCIDLYQLSSLNA